MDAPEIEHRVRERVKRLWAYKRYEGWLPYETPDRPLPQLPGLKATISMTRSDSASRSIAAAATEALEGRFKALGVEWPRRDKTSLFPATIWRLDPVTGGLWPGPEVYCFAIPYRHERTLGDIKYVWEFNRLQFLQALAAHYALTRDPAAVVVIERAIESWCEANPPFRGIAWVSGIELALRSISVLIVASLCGEALSRPTQRRIQKSLNAHVFWLKRFPSRFSSANNHLVAEAAAEFLIGVAAANVVGAGENDKGGRAILEAEALRQILADGAPAEQSPTYGAFTAEFLLLSAFVARHAGRPLSDAVEGRLRKFAEFVWWLVDANGEVPRIGDDDEGAVIFTGQHEPKYVLSVAACVLAYLESPAVGGVETPPTLRTSLFKAVELPSAPSGIKTFPDGGYTVVRENRAGRRLSLTFDHGPLGYLSIAAHGHADALAFTLTLDDQPVFVDAGTYLYHSGDEWRDWFRGTSAHNTLCIDSVDQSSISGPFNWSHKANARLEEALCKQEWLLRGSHDGYVARFGYRHERTIAATPSGLRIVDRLIGAESQPAVAVAFLVAPACNVVRTSRGVLVMRDGRPLVELYLSEGEWLLVEDGGKNGGWVSPRFGTKVPTSAIRWRGAWSREQLEFRLDFK